jgi:hypothetical protein
VQTSAIPLIEADREFAKACRYAVAAHRRRLFEALPRIAPPIGPTFAAR